MSEVPASGRALQYVVFATVALFLSYMAVAMSLPTTPVYVQHRLHYGNALGGLAVGIAFLSTILSRNHAGLFTDRTSGKAAMTRGLVVYSAASLVGFASTWSALPPVAAYAVLLAGRLLLGIGESLTLIGIIAWGIGLVGHARSGTVLAIVGAGIYGAFAAGGPLGLALLAHVGYPDLMLICAAMPLVGLALVARGPDVRSPGGARESFWRILARIWKPGAVVGLQGVGFAGLGAFISLYFASRGWPHAGLGLTCFGVGFVIVRIAFGHLPDRIGGTPVALVSLAVEACGQLLLWLAPGPLPALAGALLTGLGCSMVFPSMGREAVQRVPPHLRGTAVGGFAAFQDIAYGATGPVAGLFADHFGYPVVFLIGTVSALLGFAMAVLTHREAAAQRP